MASLKLEGIVKRRVLNRRSHCIVYLDCSNVLTKCVTKTFKLSQYGISGSAFSWLESYLSNRVQCVKVQNILSPPVDVISGVPQGTVLGPLLFLFYSAELPLVVKHSIISMFAEDKTLYKSSITVEDCHLLQDLSRVSEWPDM